MFKVKSILAQRRKDAKETKKPQKTANDCSRLLRSASSPLQPNGAVANRSPDGRAVTRLTALRHLLEWGSWCSGKYTIAALEAPLFIQRAQADSNCSVFPFASLRLCAKTFLIFSLLVSFGGTVPVWSAQPGSNCFVFPLRLCAFARERF
jgi:hypothetical protein